MLRLILAVSMVLGFSIGGVAQPVVPFEIQEYSLDSKILNEERVYSVYLHKDCEIGAEKPPAQYFTCSMADATPITLAGCSSRWREWGTYQEWF